MSGRRRGGQQSEPQPAELVAIDAIPDATSPVSYRGADEDDRLDGFVFLNWETSAGLLAVAYPTSRRSGHLYPNWVREYKPDVRCVLVVSAQQFQTPDGPVLVTNRSTDESALWRDYARVIGQPAPYWPYGLADPELIRAWRPGHQAVTAVPTMEHDMTPLIELAGRYPCDSAMHRVMTCLYRWAVYNAAEPSRSAVECMDNPLFQGLYGTNRLVLAATAEEVGKPDNLVDTFGVPAVRAVVSELLDRRDPLAEDVVACLHMGGLDQYFPHARPEHYVPAGARAAQNSPRQASVVVEQWLAQLEEVPVYLADARFGYWRLMRQSGFDRVARRFVDRAKDAPVVEVVDERGEVRAYQALVPRRLPATSPLAEWIVDGDGDYSWVRTQDGTLYPAPVGNRDVCWGHDGFIAPLVERLLDDINAEPLDRAIEPSHNRLTPLTQRQVPSGTVFTRAELEDARRTPWTPRG